MYPSQNIFGWSDQGGVDGWGMWHMGRNEMHTGFWWVYLKKRDNLQDLSVDGSIKIKIVHEYILREVVEWIHLAEDIQKS